MRRRSKIILSAVFVTLVITATATLFLVNWSSGGPSINKTVEHVATVGDPLFTRTLENLLGPPWTQGNSIKPLENGDKIFAAMLDSIRAAQHTINFETFIYWKGSIAVDFAQALSERARNGVQVRVLLDGVGASTMDDNLIVLMQEAGVIVEFFRPLDWYNLDQINNRSHRKILVVDGEVGFTGGVGIGDEWRGDAQDAEHWRDSHFEIRGPVVAQLQGGFVDHWIQAHHEVLQGAGFFPPVHEVGSSAAQAFNSWGAGGSDTVRTLYLLAISASMETIYIGTPYFVPDDFLLQALLKARKRGVEIEIMTTGDVTDSRLVQGVSRVIWGDLLEAGVRFHLFDPTLYHTKIMVVDKKFVSVGSTNFDNRSFLHNDENNLNVLDPAFAQLILEQFELDKKRSHEVTYEEWLMRPLKERLMEWYAMLFESQV
ncbi:MAG: phospholipase D-like domain-containing protein [Pseudomonadota bacterium]